MNKGFIDWLKRESPDVICLQEIKANKEQVEISEIENLGYNTFWFSAQKKGYSGVAIFSKQKPIILSCALELHIKDPDGNSKTHALSSIQLKFKVFSSLIILFLIFSSLKN